MVRIVGLEQAMLLAIILLPYGSFVTMKIITRNILTANHVGINSIILQVLVFTLTGSSFLLLWRNFPYRIEVPFFFYCTFITGLLAHLYLTDAKWKWWTNFRQRCGRFRNVVTFLIGIILAGGLFFITVILLVRQTTW